MKFALLMMLPLAACSFSGKVTPDLECTNSCDTTETECREECETECVNADGDQDSACDTDCNTVCDEEYEECTVTCGDGS